MDKTSEENEREVMFPEFESMPESGVTLGLPYRVHVYALDRLGHEELAPFITFQSEDEIAADATARNVLQNGIMDLDGEYIPARRITRVQIEEK